MVGEWISELGNSVCQESVVLHRWSDLYPLSLSSSGWSGIRWQLLVLLSAVLSLAAAGYLYLVWRSPEAVNTLLPTCVLSLAHVFTSILFTVSLWQMESDRYDRERVVGAIFILAPIAANIIAMT